MFYAKEIEFLGFIIQPGKIRMDKAKIHIILK